MKTESSLVLLAITLAGCSARSAGTSTMVIDASPDGSTVLFARDDTHAVYAQRDEAEPIVVADGDGATLLPDGSVVVSVREANGFHLRRVKDGVAESLFVTSGTQDTQPCAVGSGIAFVRSLRSRGYSMGGTVQTDYVLMYAAPGEKPRALSATPFSAMVLDPHASDEKHIYFTGARTASESEGVFRVPLSGGAEPKKLIELSTLESVTVCPEHGLIAFTDRTPIESGAVTYSVKTARTDGTDVKTASNEPAEQAIFVDQGRSLLLLRQPDLDGRYVLDRLDLASGKITTRTKLEP